MKYTQGKWKIGKSSNTSNITIDANYPICSLYGNAPNEEQLANAKLISKAPEMLETLKMMKLFFEAKVLEVDLIQNTYYKTICTAIKQATE